MKKTILFISVGLFIGLVSRANALEPPAANQLLWLKADAGVLTNGSGTVTNWLDQSGNNNNAVLSNGDPKAAVTNFGKPSDHDVVRFDGDDGFDLTDHAALRVTNVSIYSVCQLHTIGGTETMIASYDNGPENGWIHAQQGSGAVYFYTATPGDTAWGSASGTRWGRVTTTISTSTGAKIIRVNGSQEDSDTGKVVTYAGASRATVGHYIDIGYYIGDIAEILVYSSVDTNQQAQVEEYLYDKYWADPEIDILGTNDTSIADGDMTPAVSNGTDFGEVAVTDGMVTNTFTITNSGSKTLYLNSTLSPPATDLVLWLAADQGVSTNASGVTNWTDQAGGDNNATRDTGDAGYPQVTNVMLGGATRQMIYFGGNTSMQIANEDDLNLTNFTVYAVAGPFAPDADAYGGVIISDYDNSPENGWISQIEWSDASNVQWDTSQPNDRMWSLSKHSPGGHRIITTTLDGGAGDKKIYVDGNYSFSSSDTNSGWNATYAGDESVRIGKYQAAPAARYLTGNIAEILVYSDVDTNQQAEVEAYLAAKYWMVWIGGSESYDFTVTSWPTSSISASNSTTFSIVFDPTEAGVRSGLASIANTDTNENPYTFAIQGKGGVTGTIIEL